MERAAVILAYSSGSLYPRQLGVFINGRPQRSWFTGRPAHLKTNTTTRVITGFTDGATWAKEMVCHCGMDCRGVKLPLDSDCSGCQWSCDSCYCYIFGPRVSSQLMPR